MLVSIIIPNLNNECRLAKLLDRVIEETMTCDLVDDGVEVIVVDNNSSDKSVAIAKAKGIKVFIENTENSPYSCRNLGIKESAGTYIVLLDSNCIPMPGWLQAICKSINKGEVENTVYTGNVMFEFSNSIHIFERYDYLYSVIRAEDIAQRGALPATNLLFKATIIREVGYFIPAIRSLGDIEWTNRAYQAGIKLGYLEDMRVSYPAKTRLGFVKKMIRLGKGKKEVWLAKGNSFLSWRWIYNIVKSFLPPNPSFVRRMAYLNDRENTGLSMISIILMCWLTKILRGFGMLVGRVNKKAKA
jgi:glycosyltransferase AglE